MTYGTRLVLHVSPDTEEWGSADDDRWRADLAELQRLLSRELPDETQEPRASDSTRGVAEWNEVILALGSAGAMTAATEMFKAFVSARPGRRKVTVSVEQDGAPVRTVTVEADGLGATELGQLASDAFHGPAAGPPAV